MKSVTSAEVETHFDELLEQVINGEEIIITMQDKPVARLVRESVQAVTETAEA